MNRIQVAVELESATAPLAIETNNDGRSRGMAAIGPFNHEAIAGQDLGQAVGSRSCFSCAAWYGDQLHGRVHEPLAVYGPFESLDVQRRSCHG
jgi:hypothetical protein